MLVAVAVPGSPVDARSGAQAAPALSEAGHGKTVT